MLWSSMVAFKGAWVLVPCVRSDVFPYFKERLGKALRMDRRSSGKLFDAEVELNLTAAALRSRFTASVRNTSLSRRRQLIDNCRQLRGAFRTPVTAIGEWGERGRRRGGGGAYKITKATFGSKVKVDVDPRSRLIRQWSVPGGEWDAR